MFNNFDNQDKIYMQTCEICLTVFFFLFLKVNAHQYNNKAYIKIYNDAKDKKW